eukprot:TRINITY_DN6511_c0_g2_i4.p1 TRINITY_DN6511_c0_g2~~TRINITY_DN6511_c0_g2_i4.p1  ORF type:complete len:440 (+),score=70.90 TRINITY_DN6511_c0_g2_i4:101-1420(+)
MSIFFRRLFCNNSHVGRIRRFGVFNRNQFFQISKHCSRTLRGLASRLFSTQVQPVSLLTRVKNAWKKIKNFHMKKIVGDPDGSTQDMMNKIRYFTIFGKTFEYSYAIIIGHLGFIVQAVSFGFKDILGLRLISVLAGFFTLAFLYWHPHGRPLWLPFQWNVIFILTNLFRTLQILWERSLANLLTPDEEDLRDCIFDATGISNVDFLKLVKAGKWEDFPVGAVITQEKMQNSRVLLILRGKADVTVKGEHVYTLEHGNFIGEMGLHVGLHIATPLISSATVRALEPMKCMVWSRGSLMDLLEQNETLHHSMQAAITADLVRKLKLSTASNQKQLDYSAPKHQLHEKTNIEYANILKYVLEKGVVSNHERNMINRFRSIHLIRDEVHNETLSQLGWHRVEFDIGHKLNPLELEIIAKNPDAIHTIRAGRVPSKTYHPLAS